MSTVETELDIIQERLHDNEALWTRTELLRWYNDAYAALVSSSGAVRRFFVFDLPPRVPWVGTHEWETGPNGAAYRKFTKTGLGGNVQCTHEWEIETGESATPTNSNPCVTQLWEMEHAGTLDEYYRFFLPKSHERMLRVAFNDKRIFGISEKELDRIGSRWWNQEGQPEWWLRGLDRDKSFEVFQIETAYTQNYLIDENNYGMPRYLSGSRSYGVVATNQSNAYGYTSNGDIGVGSSLGWRFTESDGTYDCTQTWEIEQMAGATTFTTGVTTFTYKWETELDATLTPPDFAVGMTRAFSSPDRQYLPMAYDSGEYVLTGTIRDFKSSVNSVSILETIINVRDLQEDDSPALIPSRMAKYLRYYVWAMAFGRQGEAQNASLWQHYKVRFDEGVKFLSALTNLTNMDRNYARSLDPVLVRSRPPMPRLPATYPSLT